ncbi:MAG: hypothetical protein ACRDU8_02440 [Egibacteraceae bacterium]
MSTRWRILLLVALALLLAACGAAPGDAAGGRPDAPPSAEVPADRGSQDPGGGGVAGSPGSGQLLCRAPDAPAPGAPSDTNCSLPDESLDGTPVRPEPGMVDVRPVPWREATTNGRRLTLSWYSGVPPCSVLTRVEVSEAAERVVVTLYEGSDPSAGEDVACIEIAQAKETTVRLGRPVGDRAVVDGAQRG